MFSDQIELKHLVVGATHKLAILVADEHAHVQVERMLRWVASVALHPSSKVSSVTGIW